MSNKLRALFAVLLLCSLLLVLFPSNLREPVEETPWTVKLPKSLIATTVPKKGSITESLAWNEIERESDRGVEAFSRAFGSPWSTPTATCEFVLDAKARKIFAWNATANMQSNRMDNIEAWCHVVTSIRVISSGELEDDVCKRTFPHFEPSDNEASHCVITMFEKSQWKPVVNSQLVRKLGLETGALWELQDQAIKTSLFSIVRYAQFNKMQVLALLERDSSREEQQLLPFIALEFALRRASFALWVPRGSLIPNLGVHPRDFFTYNAKGRKGGSSVVVGELKREQQLGQKLDASVLFMRADQWSGALLRDLKQDAAKTSAPLLTGTLLEHAILKLTDKTENQRAGQPGIYADECLLQELGQPCWATFRPKISGKMIERHITMVPQARLNNTDPAFLQLSCDGTNTLPSSSCASPALVALVNATLERVAHFWPAFISSAFCVVQDLSSADLDDYN